MPKARSSSYNMAFKLKVVAEAEAVENNSEIAREYGLSESIVRRWRKDQAKLFNDDHGSLHSEVSRAGPAETGVVYQTEDKLNNCLI